MANRSPSSSRAKIRWRCRTRVVNVASGATVASVATPRKGADPPDWSSDGSRSHTSVSMHAGRAKKSGSSIETEPVFASKFEVRGSRQGGRFDFSRWPPRRFRGRAARALSYRADRSGIERDSKYDRRRQRHARVSAIFADGQRIVLRALGMMTDYSKRVFVMMWTHRGTQPQPPPDEDSTRTGPVTGGGSCSPACAAAIAAIRIDLSSGQTRRLTNNTSMTWRLRFTPAWRLGQVRWSAARICICSFGASGASERGRR